MVVANLSCWTSEQHPFPWSDMFPAEPCLGLTIITPSISWDQRGPEHYTKENNLLNYCLSVQFLVITCCLHQSTAMHTLLCSYQWAYAVARSSLDFGLLHESEYMAAAK